jgi:arsenate reductase
MSLIKLYGIPHCDTVKKARAFLDARNISYDFIDFKKCLPREEDILRWETALGELPVNKKGITYKRLRTQFEVLNDKDRVSFIQQNSSLIKRPILEKCSAMIIFGFSEDQYKTLFL